MSRTDNSLTPDRSWESRVHLGDFELDLVRGELTRRGESVALRPLASRALVVLARHPEQLVTREELRRALWGDSAVEWNQGVNQVVRQIRRALGDDARNPSYIETVPRRGYRLRAPVARCEIHGSVGARGADGDSLRYFAAGVMITLALPLILILGCALLANA